MASVTPISDDEFAKILQSYSLPKHSHLAVAVSGGADSMCLLLLLHRWCKRYQHKLTALTVDHGLRKEAKQEAEQVKAWCNSLEIDHQTLTWEGDIPTSNIQAEARKIRYTLLETYCTDHRIHSVFLGHHHQDQAETVLLSLMRGGSVGALSGMKYSSFMSEITLLRPLLSFSKQRILATLTNLNQSHIEDPSNDDSRFMRVSIRQFLNTLDRKDEIITHINKSASHMQRLDDFISLNVIKAEKECVTLHPFGFSAIDKHRYFEQHTEIGLRLLARQLCLISGESQPPRFEELERLYLALKSAIYSAMTLHGCLIKHGTAQHNQHQVFIIRETNALPVDTAFRSPLVFDKRFKCFHPEEYEDHSEFTVGALGIAGWLSVKDAIKVEKLPKEVFYALPALKHLEKVVAVPHISFVADTKAKDFSAHFLID